MIPEENASTSPGEKRDLDAELDRLEASIAELRVQYEQHFVDILLQPPTDLHRAVQKQMRSLLRAPFKNSALRFRLRTLVQRYNTYATYWERVLKQRDDGSYHKDIFKASMRERLAETRRQEMKRDARDHESGMRQLFSAYQEALEKTTGIANKLSYEAFKKSLLQKAHQLEGSENGKVNYKIVVREGKVLVKASTGKRVGGSSTNDDEFS